MASGLIFDEDGRDITMDALEQAPMPGCGSTVPDDRDDEGLVDRPEKRHRGALRAALPPVHEGDHPTSDESMAREEGQRVNEQITTAEQMEALPPETVIRSGSGRVYVAVMSRSRYRWYAPGSGGGDGWSDEAVNTPVTVLYRPDVPTVSPAALSREAMASALWKTDDGDPDWTWEQAKRDAETATTDSAAGRYVRHEVEAAYQRADRVLALLGVTPVPTPAEVAQGIAQAIDDARVAVARGTRRTPSGVMDTYVDAIRVAREYGGAS